MEEEGGQGQGEGPPSPFLSRSVGEEGGLGGKVRAALTPNSSPALRERGDLVRELGIVKDAGAPLLRSTPPFLSLHESGSGLGGR